MGTVVLDMTCEEQSVFQIQILYLKTADRRGPSRVLLLEIQAFFESEDGQREYAEWKAKQQAEQENKS